jgi:hypothetical protein
MEELSSMCDGERFALFVWLISQQPAVLFSQNKSAITNQPTVLFSQNKPAPAISHQQNEQADCLISPTSEIDGGGAQHKGQGSPHPSR